MGCHNVCDRNLIFVLVPATRGLRTIELCYLYLIVVVRVSRLFVPQLDPTFRDKKRHRVACQEKVTFIQDKWGGGGGPPMNANVCVISNYLVLHDSWSQSWLLCWLRVLSQFFIGHWVLHYFHSSNFVNNVVDSFRRLLLTQDESSLQMYFFDVRRKKWKICGGREGWTPNLHPQEST